MKPATLESIGLRKDKSVDLVKVQAAISDVGEKIIAYAKQREDERCKEALKLENVRVF